MRTRQLYKAEYQSVSKHLEQSKAIISVHQKNLKNPHCLKMNKNVSFEFLNWAVSTIFCPVKKELSRNNV